MKTRTAVLLNAVYIHQMIDIVIKSNTVSMGPKLLSLATAEIALPRIHFQMGIFGNVKKGGEAYIWRESKTDKTKSNS